MRKKLPIFTTGLTAAALLSIMTMSTFAAQITQENAKTIALTHAGIAEKDTAYLRVESDWDDGRQIYDVKFFTKAYAEYNYDILADSGKIINIEYDAEAVLSQNSGSFKKTSIISLEKAKETAAAHTGRKKDEVTFTKAETDRDDGRQVYEIEFFTDELEKYEFTIDAETGMIESWEFDAEEKDIPEELRNKQNTSEKPTSTSAASATDSLASVKSAVLKKAGFKESDVTWGRIHSDYDDGRQIYEGKFFQGRLEYEFEVDAKTMTVIDWDVERIDD